MTTECNPEQLAFHALGRREVVGRFDGGRITSDGGGLLLREVDQRIGLIDRLARCFVDHRNPNSVEHRVRELVAQRTYGWAVRRQGLSDHVGLRPDGVLALLVANQDVPGRGRKRAGDSGQPLAGSSALHRLQLTTPASAPTARYKRVAANPE